MNVDKKHVDVIVVGAGPAGMMAAGQAVLGGASTVLLEKTDAVGKKLSITGKKRCNLTNSAPLAEFIDHFGREGQFLRQVFYQYFRDELLAFFHELGVRTEVERGGRIFPSNGDAASVTEAIYRWVKSLGVEIFQTSRVEKILFESRRVIGVQLTGGSSFYSNAVIMCTGGSTFIGTGSTGDGYRMAAEVGHTITPIRPALVPLKTSGTIAKKLQGLSLRNIRMQVFSDEKKLLDAFGEFLFTHFGISGPIVLTHSGKIVDELQCGKKVSVRIDLKPALNESVLDKRILRELDEGKKQHLQRMLKKLLPMKMILVCCEETDIPPDRPCHQITAEERKRIIHWMKNLQLIVTGPLSLESGMVTMGGVSLGEIDPRTMMSKKIDGLYFAGEVMDLAADTGGFNLQAAFSTGWLAGKKAAQFRQSD